MPRYIHDPRLRDFKRRVREEVSRVSALAGDAPYVIYAIRDPTRPDPRRQHEHGPPIYVGQTKQMVVRAEAHMRDGGEARANDRCKSGLLKRIMEKWVVPRFEILDTAPTHLTSLIAETVWARRFIWLGYELANEWREHQTAEAPRGIATVPKERLWSFACNDAIQDEISVYFECSNCRKRAVIDLSALPPTVLLRELREDQIGCTVCGTRIRCRVAHPDPMQWRWKSYQPKAASRAPQL